MKTLRIVAIYAATLIVGHASAQEQVTVPQDTPPAAQDVGGTSQISGSDSGSSMKITRQQVYNQLVQSRQSGEQARLQHDLYRGN